MEFFAGIDIGGTRIKAAVYDRRGQVIATALEPGEALCGDGWRASAVSALKNLEAQTGQRLERVGVAAPGLPAEDGRSIREMPGRLAGLVGLDWTAWLGRAIPVPVINDGSAALLGEVWCGVATGLRDCFMLTLGTGVGGAILSGGKLLRGHHRRAGHMGHMSLDPWGSPGIVGTPGSLEDAVGNHTIQRRSAGRFTMTSDLLAAVDAGDPAAIEVWERSIRSLAAGIASLINVLDPAAVVLGGGIMTAGQKLLGPLHRYLDEMQWLHEGRPVPLLTAALGENAGTCGAAAVACGVFS